MEEPRLAWMLAYQIPTPYPHLLTYLGPTLVGLLFLLSNKTIVYKPNTSNQLFKHKQIFGHFSQKFQMLKQ